MNKRLYLALIVVLAVASVGAGARATSAASTAAQSNVVVFKARMDGSQVVPGNSYPGVGWATVSFDTALKTMTTDLRWFNLSGPSDSAHVHSGANGAPPTGSSPMRYSTTLIGPSLVRGRPRPGLRPPGRYR